MPLTAAGARPTVSATESREPERLDHPDPAVRRAAARAMAGAPGSVAALAERLEVEHDPSVRVYLFDAIAATGGAEAAVALTMFVRSDDAGLRGGAVGALRRLPDEVAPHMEALLADADPDVRIMAVDVLKDLRLRDAARWLAERLRVEHETNVAGVLIDHLVEIGEPDAAPAIEAARARFADEPYLVFACDAALAAVRSAA